MSNKEHNPAGKKPDRHIYYENGPNSLVAGKAGKFEAGVSKPVPHDLAEALLKRTDIKFKEGAREKQSEPAAQKK